VDRDHPKLLLLVLGLSILSYARARRLPVGGPNRKKLLTPFLPDPSIHTEPPPSGLRLFTFVHLVSPRLAPHTGVLPPNTLEAQFDLPILGSST